jgi:glycosyltransferase involved in cell wall biosynthesis
MIKLSIITVVKNGQDTIEECINSVRSQTVPVEHIIIDGGSTDRTVDIIKKSGIKACNWVSEPDKGIYDAINKGINLTTGEVIGILQSDDVYANNTVLEKVSNTFALHGVDSCYGDIVYVSRVNINKYLRYWRPGEYKPGSYRWGWQPPHPSFFVSRNVYLKYGTFNLKYRISADDEIMLRFLEKDRISTCYIPEILVKMRIGGESHRSIRNIIRGNIEAYCACKDNGFAVNPLYFLRRFFYKTKQLWGK